MIVLAFRYARTPGVMSGCQHETARGDVADNPLDPAAADIQALRGVLSERQVLRSMRTIVPPQSVSGGEMGA